jgi:hypothetical protein
MSEKERDEEEGGREAVELARAQGMRTGCFGSEDTHCVRKECRNQRPRWFISN